MSAVTEQTDTARAERLYRDSLVWDMVLPLDPPIGNDVDLLDRYSAAGIDHLAWTLAGDEVGGLECLHRIGRARSHLLHHDRFVLVETVSDIDNARRDGKLAVTLQFEGTRMFERDLNLVEPFYKLGARMAILAFNKVNYVGGGCADRIDIGLTRFGQMLVREMERVGMLIDLSHVGYRTTMETMELASRPLIFSHSNVAAIQPHFRNLRDDQIRGCARIGGVIGLSGSASYLGDPSSSAASLFRHLDYIAQLVGPGYVGFGLDPVMQPEKMEQWIADHPDEWPADLLEGVAHIRHHYAGPEVIRRVVDEMVASGYPDEAVEGILGQNFRRVCAAVWH